MYEQLSIKNSGSRVSDRSSSSNFSFLVDSRDGLALISISRQCISLRMARAMIVGGCVMVDSNAVSICGGIIIAFCNVVDSMKRN